MYAYRARHDLGRIRDQVGQLLPDELRREPHRFFLPGTILIDGEGNHRAIPRVQQLIVHEPRHLPDERHEPLLHSPSDFVS